MTKAEKERFLLGLARQNGADALLVEQQPTICWLLGGRPFTNVATTTGLCSLVVSSTGLHLVVNNIERERLLAEEFLAGDLTIHEYEWHDEAAKNRLVAEAAQGALIRDSIIESSIRAERVTLNGEELAAAKTLGRDAGLLVEDVLFGTRPGATELSIAANCAGRCIELGISPNTILVGADSRARLYRHPLPTMNPVHSHAVVVLVARRNGLHVALTRSVAFGSPSADLARDNEKISRVNAAFVAATRPGATTAEVLGVGIDAYAAVGHPDGWRGHHQGGLTGYNSREFKVTPDMPAITIKSGMLAAWNPSLPGVKAEDTYAVTDSAPVLLTPTPRLPASEVIQGGVSVKTAGILVR